MSEFDDSRSGGPAGDSAPDGYDETVVEILSLGDEADAADVPGAGSRTASADARHIESQLAAERERMLRLRADFDNYRKRTERERGEVERYALADMLRELLPVVDNLERALEAQSEGADLRKGIEMIARQFQELLKRQGLSPIPALGERFDPSVHEAVFQE
ncbi:MAG: nucleotide exchange factor GrpE, partial [Thermoanaerobaculia bacterium]